MKFLKRAVREPFLHFLVIGFALFGAFNLLGEEPPPSSETIIVTGPIVERLREQFIRTWSRPPTPAEADGLVEAYVRDEVLYREAIALGLDRDDSIVRQRMRQKMEFLVDSTLDLAEPDANALTEFLERHADDYRTPDRLSFVQIRVGDGNPDAVQGPDIQAVLSELNADPAAPPAPGIGEPTLLPFDNLDVTTAQIVRLFGDAFASALDYSIVGSWQGPIESAFGVHLVRIDSVSLGDLPELGDIRTAVERDWRAEQRRTLQEDFYAALADGYQIVVLTGGDMDSDQ